MTSWFGLLTGSWVASESPLLVQLVGLTQLTPAFGLLTAGGGIAALAGPPLAGVAAELSGPWVALEVAGALMAGSGLVYGLASVVHKRSRMVKMEMYNQL